MGWLADDGPPAVGSISGGLPDTWKDSCRLCFYRADEGSPWRIGIILTFPTDFGMMQDKFSWFLLLISHTQQVGYLLIRRG